MNTFSLHFKDKILEESYQQALNYAKFPHFHQYLMIELLIIMFATVFNLIQRPFFLGRLVLNQFTIFFLFLVIYIVKKHTKWRYFLHTLVIIHILVIIGMIEVVYADSKIDEEGFRIDFNIFAITIHIFFSCLLLTRLHWIILTILNFLFQIYYIFRVFTIDIFQNYLLIVPFHFVVSVTCSLMAFHLENIMRKCYHVIYDSNKKNLEFQVLLKNVIPSPIFIVDFENKKIRFYNNSAYDFLKKINDNSRSNSFIDLLKYDDHIINEKNLFSWFEKMIFQFKTKIHNENDNQSELYNILLNFYNMKERLSLSINANDKFNFESQNLYLMEETSENLDSFKIFNLKFLKLNWESKKTLLLIFNDITDLHKLEELKHLDEYKNRLLTAVSHDLRTPVNGMIGMIDMVIPNLKDKKDIKYLNIANRSAQLLLNMIGDILDLSQINNKKLRLNLQSLDLVNILKETSKLLKFSIKLKGLSFILDLPKNPCNIFSDPIRIKQIVLNLLGNALKFTQQGFIKLKIEEFMKIYYKISVEDSGIGIKEEDKSKLFKLFGKLDTNTNELNKHGVGLGLSISKNLSLMLNKNDPNGIYLESTYGKGSKFWFFLMKEENSSIDNSNLSIFNEKKDEIKVSYEEIEKKTINIIKTQKKITALLVDDDMINLLIEKQYCEYFKYDYLTANDGLEAVNIIEKTVCEEKKNIDCIFMDCNMPIMDGLNASFKINKILKDNNMHDIPIFIISAGVVKDMLHHKENSGIKTILTKPISKKTFGETISKYLNINS